MLGLFIVWTRPQIKLLVWTALILIHFLHIRMLVLGLTKSFDAISREFHGHTWSLVIMTNVSARKLVMGKWWAVMRGLLPTYIWVIQLKVILMIWQLAQIHHLMRDNGYLNLHFFDFALGSGLSVFLIIVGLLFNLSITVVIGLLASLMTAGKQRSWGISVALLVVFFLSGMTVIGMLAFLIFPDDIYPTYYNSHGSIPAYYVLDYNLDWFGYEGAYPQIFASLAMSIGTGPVLVIVHLVRNATIDTTTDFIRITASCLTFYIIAFWTLLRASRYVAYRQGMSK